MKKDEKIFLMHILDSIEAVEKYLHEISYDEFANSEHIQDAVIRKFEVIGEAAKNLSDEYRAQHKEIPWQKLTGMRDKLIHEYFGVDLDVVWDSAKEDMPPLKEQIKKLI